MSSLWSKISNFVHGAEVKVSEVFVKVFGADAAHKFGQAALTVLKTAEGKVVLDAIAAVEAANPAADGSAKRAAAFGRIAGDFKSQGIVVGESLVNLMIELGVQFLKGGIAAA